jgi:uncharacterized protein YjiS (DUF1127 family)
MESQNLLHQDTCPHAAALPIRSGLSVRHRLARGIAWLDLALTIRRERHDLAGLPPHLLRDIGLTDTEASTESQRPWHQIPLNRLRR